MARLSVLLLVVATVAGCNGLAGISDFRNGDLTAPGVPGSAPGSGFDASPESGGVVVPSSGTVSGAPDASSDGTTDSSVSGPANPANSSDSGASAVVDAGIGGTVTANDASPSTTGCASATVALVISVIASSSGQFTGVFSDSSAIPPLNIGQSFQGCVPQGTTIDLRAAPGDLSNAVHNWGACGTGRRCDTTIAQPTTIDVHLQ